MMYKVRSHWQRNLGFMLRTNIDGGGGASDKGSVLYSYFIPLKGKEFFVYSTITSLKTFQSCIGYEKGCFLFLAMRKKKIKECAVLLEQIIHPSLSR